MNEWIAALAEFAAAEVPCVLVTLVEARGSAPREGGAKMIVSEDRALGTLGGGTVELRAQEYARRLLAEGAGEPRLEAFNLDAKLDQACGGRVRLLFEPVLPATFHIALFGAGHVGRALVRVLEGVSCRIRWVDSREGVFAQPLPGHVQGVLAAQPEDEVASLPAGSYVIAMTHSHDIDFRIVGAALQRPDLAFVGMIGSRSKLASFTRRWRRAGEPVDIERLVCPIGLHNVGGKQPAEIAIAVAAQLLQVRQRDPAGASEPARAG